MATVLRAGVPLVPLEQAVARRGATLVDAARADRSIAVDCWYPAVAGADAESVYELLPGIGFTASARDAAAALPGAHPLVVFSHGRMGTRSSYAMLCEALATRGWVVVAPDHPGDTLGDWLLGTAVDDATNEAQRVADLRFVLDELLDGGLAALDGVTIDRTRIAAAGHSYGGFSALALAGAEPVDRRIGAVAGLQAFTRTLPAATLARIDVPVALIVGARDTSCPPVTDADPAFAALAPGTATRFDLPGVGHQGCSDVGLYLELAPQVDDLPEFVAEFVGNLAADITGTPGEPWRPTVALHARLLGAWLADALDIDRATACRDLDALAATGAVTVRRSGLAATG